MAAGAPQLAVVEDQDERYAPIEDIAAAGEVPAHGEDLSHHSLASAVRIIEQDLGGVLGGLPLRWNEMVSCSFIGERRLEDFDVTAVRLAMETELTAPDKNGRPAPLSIGADTVYAALELVARRRAYHPVREYLRSLTWDGEPRLHLVASLIGAEPSPLNQAILRAWFVGAASRPLEPGCLMQFVLILVGPQGVGKSTLLRELASPEWFGDSAIDVGNKDAYQVLHESWICEWAELDALKRARDAAALKAFITSAVDTYRPPYGRITAKFPRSGVIVGTTNEAEFLADDSGNRRFWPVVVSTIDLPAIKEIRDQLWAEAVAAVDGGERCVLGREESEQLEGVHHAHEISDAWAAPVLDWAEGRSAFTIGDVLQGALLMPSKDWSKSDEMRVGSILQRARFLKSKSGGVRKWRCAKT